MDRFLSIPLLIILIGVSIGVILEVSAQETFDNSPTITPPTNSISEPRDNKRYDSALIYVDALNFTSRSNPSGSVYILTTMGGELFSFNERPDLELNPDYLSIMVTDVEDKDGSYFNGKPLGVKGIIAHFKSDSDTFQFKMLLSGLRQMSPMEVTFTGECNFKGYASEGGLDIDVRSINDSNVEIHFMGLNSTYPTYYTSVCSSN